MVCTIPLRVGGYCFEAGVFCSGVCLWFAIRPSVRIVHYDLSPSPYWSRFPISLHTVVYLLFVSCFSFEATAAVVLAPFVFL